MRRRKAGVVEAACRVPTGVSRAMRLHALQPACRSRRCRRSACARGRAAPWPSSSRRSRGRRGSLCGTRAFSNQVSEKASVPPVVRKGFTVMPGVFLMSASRKVMPSCFLPLGVGAREHEDPVGVLRVGGPGLLAVQHVVVAVLLGAQLQATRGRSPRSAPSSPDTRPRRPRGSSAGSAASARRCRTGSAAGRPSRGRRARARARSRARAPR